MEARIDEKMKNQKNEKNNKSKKKKKKEKTRKQEGDWEKKRLFTFMIFKDLLQIICKDR